MISRFSNRNSKKIMKKELNHKIFSGVAMAALLVSTAALPALTQAAGITTLGVGVNASASATVGIAGLSARAAALIKLVSTAQARADQEITRRINALNALNTRVNAMVKISASDKSSLSSNIATQI